jgi:hypothetical protein
MMFLLLMCLPVIGDVNYDSMPVVGLERIYPIASTTVAMNDATIARGAVFVATKTSLTSVKVMCSAVAGTPAYRLMKVFVVAVDAAGDPDESAPLANGTKEQAVVAGLNTFTFATPPALTVGTVYGIYVQNTATGAGNPTVDYATIYESSGSILQRDFPFVSISSDGTVWTRHYRVPSVCPVYSDGYAKGFFPGFSVALTLAGDHTPDEYAAEFTVLNPTLCTGVTVIMAGIANDDVVFTLYEDQVSKATVTIADHQFYESIGTRLLTVEWPAYSCHAGHTYDISIYTAGTAHASIWCNQYFDAGTKVAHFGTKIWGAVRTDLTGAFTAYNSASDYRVYPIIPLFGVETISAGSVSSGFNGGFDQ